MTVGQLNKNHGTANFSGNRASEDTESDGIDEKDESGGIYEKDESVGLMRKMRVMREGVMQRQHCGQRNFLMATMKH